MSLGPAEPHDSPVVLGPAGRALWARTAAVSTALGLTVEHSLASLACSPLEKDLLPADMVEAFFAETLPLVSAERTAAGTGLPTGAGALSAPATKRARFAADEAEMKAVGVGGVEGPRARAFVEAARDTWLSRLHQHPSASHLSAALVPHLTTRDVMSVHDQAAAARPPSPWRSVGAPEDSPCVGGSCPGRALPFHRTFLASATLPSLVSLAEACGNRWLRRCVVERAWRLALASPETCAKEASALLALCRLEEPPACNDPRHFDRWPAGPYDALAAQAAAANASAAAGMLLEPRLRGPHAARLQAGIIHMLPSAPSLDDVLRSVADGCDGPEFPAAMRQLAAALPPEGAARVVARALQAVFQRPGGTAAVTRVVCAAVASGSHSARWRGIVSDLAHRRTELLPALLTSRPWAQPGVPGDAWQAFWLPLLVSHQEAAGAGRCQALSDDLLLSVLGGTSGDGAASRGPMQPELFLLLDPKRLAEAAPREFVLTAAQDPRRLLHASPSARAAADVDCLRALARSNARLFTSGGGDDGGGGGMVPAAALPAASVGSREGAALDSLFVMGWLGSRAVRQEERRSAQPAQGGQQPPPQPDDVVLACWDSAAARRLMVWTTDTFAPYSDGSRAAEPADPAPFHLVRWAVAALAQTQTQTQCPPACDHSACGLPDTRRLCSVLMFAVSHVGRHQIVAPGSVQRLVDVTADLLDERASRPSVDLGLALARTVATAARATGLFGSPPPPPAVVPALARATATAIALCGDGNLRHGADLWRLLAVCHECLCHHASLAAGTVSRLRDFCARPVCRFGAGDAAVTPKALEEFPLFFRSLRRLLHAAAATAREEPGGGRAAQHPALNRCLRIVGHLSRVPAGLSAILGSEAILRSLLELLAAGASRSNTTLALQLVVEHGCATATAGRLAAACAATDMVGVLLRHGLSPSAEGAADCVENVFFILSALTETAENALKRQLAALLPTPRLLLDPLDGIAGAEGLRGRLLSEPDFCFDLARVLSFCCRTNAFLEALLPPPTPATRAGNLPRRLLPGLLRTGAEAERQGELQTARAIVQSVERMAAGGWAKRRMRDLGLDRMLADDPWAMSGTECGGRLYRVGSGISLCR